LLRAQQQQLAADGAISSRLRMLLSELSVHSHGAHSSHGHALSSHGKAVPAAAASSSRGAAVNTAAVPGGFVPGAFGGGGAAPWVYTAGAVTNGIGYAASVGTALVAPIVNGIASNVPVMVPALGGKCLRGQPIVLPQAPDLTLCIVGNGAQVTNYLFGAGNALIGALGGGIGMIGQFGRR
jgi:hypothetical protein